MQPVDAVNREQRENNVVKQNDHRGNRQPAVRVILLSALIALIPASYVGGGTARFLSMYVLATLVWVALMRSNATHFTRGIFLLAVVLRLALWINPPMLSSDVYRYLWDSKVSWSGSNPYSFAPSDAPPDVSRPSWFHEINHPEVRSIYPPHAQLLFLLSGGYLMIWRIVLLLSDILLLRLLRRHASPSIALSYAFCPLVLLEGHWSAHIEPVVALTLFASVALAHRQSTSGALLALATGLKISPLATLPAMFVSTRSRLRFACTFTFVLAAPALLYLSSPMMPGMREFARRWIFNAPVFETLLELLARIGISARLKASWTAWKDRLDAELVSAWVYEHLYDDFLARVSCAMLLVISLVVIARLRTTIDSKAAHSMGALLLFSPVVHPWYWIAGLPLFLTARTSYWIAAAVLSPLSYLLYDLNARGSWSVAFLSWGVPGLIALGHRLINRGPRAPSRAFGVDLS